jgi:uncharacterized protein YfaQ (DUF2300 family)
VQEEKEKHRMQRPKQITALVTMNRNHGNSRRWHAHARVAVVHPIGMAREGTGAGAGSAIAGKRALEVGISELLQALKQIPAGGCATAPVMEKT